MWNFNLLNLFYKINSSGALHISGADISIGLLQKHLQVLLDRWGFSKKHHRQMIGLMLALYVKAKLGELMWIVSLPNPFLVRKFQPMLWSSQFHHSKFKHGKPMLACNSNHLDHNASIRKLWFSMTWRSCKRWPILKHLQSTWDLAAGCHTSEQKNKCQTSTTNQFEVVWVPFKLDMSHVITVITMFYGSNVK